MKKIYYLYNSEEKPLLLNANPDDAVSEFTNDEIVSQFCDGALDKNSNVVILEYDTDAKCNVFKLDSKTAEDYELYVDSDFKYTENGKHLWDKLILAKRYSQDIHAKKGFRKLELGLAAIGLVTVLGFSGFILKKGFETYADHNNKQFEAEWKEVEESYEYQNYKQIQDRKQQMEEREEYNRQQEQQPKTLIKRNNNN